MAEDNGQKYIVKETARKDIYNNYTYGDYLTWDDDKRYELIEGQPYLMSPAPSRRHQEISVELVRQFSNYLLDKECNVYAAPFDVRLPEGEEEDEDIFTVVQPDLVVVCDSSKLDERGCRGTPDLVIEIVSPSSDEKDKKVKKKLYEKHGIQEYWLVDFKANKIEVYLLNDERKYNEPVIYIEKEYLPVSIFTDLEINLKQVFRDRKNI